MSAASSFAILSPCSTCSNQRAAPDSNGGMQNFCPRRAAQNSYKAILASPITTEAQLAPILRHLALTGIENQDSSGTFTGNLVNPVYDNTGHSILVWVARVDHNTATVNPSNSAEVLNPSILAGPSAFDTNYIQCESLPFCPETNEASFFQSGGLREWETLSIVPNIIHQNSDSSAIVPLGGSVKRAILVGQTPRIPVNDHSSPEGT